jgi:hypothetical protein
MGANPDPLSPEDQQLLALHLINMQALEAAHTEYAARVQECAQKYYDDENGDLVVAAEHVEEQERDQAALLSATVKLVIELSFTVMARIYICRLIKNPESLRNDSSPLIDLGRDIFTNGLVGQQRAEALRAHSQTQFLVMALKNLHDPNVIRYLNAPPDSSPEERVALLNESNPLILPKLGYFIEDIVAHSTYLFVRPECARALMAIENKYKAHKAREIKSRFNDHKEVLKPAYARTEADSALQWFLKMRAQEDDTAAASDTVALEAQGIVNDRVATFDMIKRMIEEVLNRSS